LTYSLPLLPFYLVGYFSGSYLDALFISKYLTSSDLGLYAIATQMSGIAMQFPLLAGSLLLPLFVTLRKQKLDEKVRAYMENVVPLLTICGSVGGICTAYLVNFFVLFTFGTEYRELVIIFWILAAGSVFALPGYIGYVPFYNSASATYVATINSIVASVVNVGANMMLIPNYGLKGCAWATTLSSFASFITTSIIIGKRFSLKQTLVLLATVPSLVASMYASWTDDFFTSLILMFLVTVFIVAMSRRDLLRGARTIYNLRGLHRQGKIALT
jgi:O-antigen/teichoic acid export membrane protein